MAEQQKEQPPSGSRRQFLKYSGTAIGGLVVGGVIGGAITGGFNKKKPAANAPTSPQTGTQPAADYNHATMYFNQRQLQITQAATERIFPKDENGPGANDLGVAYYIDHQLAGHWGFNAREYRMGPFIKGEATQGDYQSINRNEVFLLGLSAIDNASQKKYQKSFTEITDEQKDDILTSLEKGDIEVINGITGKSFFDLLRNMTLEGAYSDPLYGGNVNMEGWKMRNYPGNQMSYAKIIGEDAFAKTDPLSLHDHLATH